MISHSFTNLLNNHFKSQISCRSFLSDLNRFHYEISKVDLLKNMKKISIPKRRLILIFNVNNEKQSDFFSGYIDITEKIISPSILRDSLYCIWHSDLFWSEGYKKQASKLRRNRKLLYMSMCQSINNGYVTRTNMINFNQISYLHEKLYF